MSQIAIYLDTEIQKKMDQKAREEGKSRSEWVKEAIREKLLSERPSGEWFKVWGSWEDSRTPEEILQDIDGGFLEREREPIK